MSIKKYTGIGIEFVPSQNTELYFQPKSVVINPASEIQCFGSGLDPDLIRPVDPGPGGQK